MCGYVHLLYFFRSISELKHYSFFGTLYNTRVLLKIESLEKGEQNFQ